ncbi:unnamed protein product, partial [Sphagnum troendelagicum]
SANYSKPDEGGRCKNYVQSKSLKLGSLPASERILHFLLSSGEDAQRHQDQRTDRKLNS